MLSSELSGSNGNHTAAPAPAHTAAPARPDGLDRLLADVNGVYVPQGNAVMRGTRVVAVYESPGLATRVATAMNTAAARHLPPSRPPSREEARLILAAFGDRAEDAERFDGMS